MTENLKKRILTVVIGGSLSFSVIFLLPFFNHLVFCLIIIAAGIIGTFEISRMLFSQVKPVVFLAWLVPFSQYISSTFGLDTDLPFLILVLLLMVLFSTEIISGEKDDFKSSLSSAAKNTLAAVYPSFFLTFLVRLTLLEKTDSMTLALFFILVFSNDIFAYVFGMIFGRNNAGVFKASPKKSLAGFIGGAAMTILLSVIFAKDIDSVFLRIVLGLLMSLCADIGDLAESVFKRSVDVKDSGKLIPGRGGILDCIDSICAAAPVYYLMMQLGETIA